MFELGQSRAKPRNKQVFDSVVEQMETFSHCEAGKLKWTCAIVHCAVTVSVTSSMKGSRGTEIFNLIRFVIDREHEIKRKTRPDARLPKSRAGGKGQCWKRSPEHLSRRSRLKKKKNAEIVKRGPTDRPTDQPTDRRTDIAGFRVA